MQRFNQVFQPLFQKGLPNFWDFEGKLITESLYVESLIKARVDHAKFQDMVKGLKGEVLIGKLKDDFELTVMFKSIKSSMPIVTHDPLIELDVMLKEMWDAKIPTDAGWKEIHGLGSQILKLPSEN